MAYDSVLIKLRSNLEYTNDIDRDQFKQIIRDDRQGP